MSLAIFDLDHTILQGDSDSAWLQFLVDKNKVDKVTVEKMNGKFYDDYMHGRLEFDDYANFAFGIISSIHISNLKTLRKEYFKQRIIPMIRPKAVALLESHRRREHTIVLSTATNEFISRPVAEYLKVDHLIATQLEKSVDGFTGNVFGTPNFREGKVTNILEWLKDNTRHQLATAYFYSDSINDLPLLLAVGYPRPVNADPALLEKARENRWRNLNLSK